MNSATSDIESRQPVWEALSELFLDTDTSIARDRRAGVLASSPYSVDDLERILADEVYPICRWNLLDVVGEWAAFDRVWLRKRILRRVRRPHLGGRKRRRAVQRLPEWQATRSVVEQLRGR